MEVVTYARVSTAGQAEHGYSLGEQQARLQAFCRERGYTLREHIADEGISGRLADRPGLRRILDLAETGQIGGVVAVNLSRLGRENRLIQEVLHQVRQRGVRLEFCEHASGDRPADRLLVNVLGGVAEWQWADLREKTMNGRDAKAKTRGVSPIGKAPYGYRIVSKAMALALPEYAGRDGELLLDEEKAELVRELFERYATEGSLRGLTTWANAQAERFGRTFSKPGIYALLRNPVYKGQPEYGRRRYENVKGKRRQTADHGGERIPLKPCPPIVSEELFNAVQERLAENAQKLSGRPSANWLLKGIVSCGECEPTRYGRLKSCCGYNKRNRPRYVCITRWDKAERFCGTQYDAPTLEALVREALVQAAAPEVLASAERARIEELNRAAGDPAAQLKRAKAALAELEAEEEKIADLALQGFSQAVVTRKLAAVNERRLAAQETLLRAQSAARAVTSPDAAAARAEALAERLRAAVEDPDRLMELARQVVRVTLFKDKGPQIEIRVPVA